MNEMTTANIPRDEFPILAHGFYANHAAVAPWPRVTAEAVARFAQENTELGPERYGHWLRRETRLRKRLADLINASSEHDIALLKNTTEGICTVAGGVAWNKGDNIIIPLGEFSSNRLPWLALQGVGVEVREVDIRAAPDPEQALLERMDGRTRLLAVSAVQWSDGFRLHLELLGNACRSNGSLFFVDAIQALGALQLDVDACSIDFLAADGHKWLLAPEGVAVFYCRDTVREQLQLRQVGWHMVDEPNQFDRTTWQPSKTASRFEAGSPNMLGQVALDASVGLLQQIGLRQVENLVSENSRKLASGLADIRGLELSRPFNAERLSGFVNFCTPGRNIATFYRALKNKHVVCSLRDGGIRLSPHFYQAGVPLQDILNVVELSNN